MSHFCLSCEIGAQQLKVDQHNPLAFVLLLCRERGSHILNATQQPSYLYSLGSQANQDL